MKLSGVTKGSCFNKILDPWAEEPLIKKYEQLKKTRGKQNCQENRFSQSYNNRLFLKTENGQDCTARFVTYSDTPRPRTIESKSIAFDSTTNPNLLSDVVKIKCNNIPLFLTYRVNRNPNFVKRSQQSHKRVTQPLKIVMISQDSISRSEFARSLAKTKNDTK